MQEHTITIAGQELPLGFDVRGWVKELEPEFGSFHSMTERLGSQDKPITAGIAMLAIAINAGYRLQGEKKTVTRDWLMDNLPPAEVALAIRKGQNAIYASFEQQEKNDDAPVDVVLAEMEKKAPGSA